MIRISAPRRGSKFSALGYALALSLGVAGGAVAVSSPAYAGGPSFSPEFMKVAPALQEALNKNKGKTLTGADADTLKKQLAAVVAAAKTPDDKVTAGSWSLNTGGIVGDTELQKQGVRLMLDSGKAPADIAPKLHFFSGQFAYQDKDYPLAITELKTAIAAGFPDPNASIELAECYFNSNDTANGLTALQDAIARTTAAKQQVPDSWYSRGLSVAYNTKNLGAAVQFGSQLVSAYPGEKKNWTALIEVVHALTNFDLAQNLDLLRLMDRTGSWGEERDYVDFIEAADARRNPGEVKRVIEAGVAAGTLKAGNQLVADALHTSTVRIAADKASLPGFERDARAPSANAATTTGAADAFLSYGEAAKAADLYKLAATKPGADQQLINNRLGIALIDSGDYAGAKAVLAKVTGPRQTIAQLWSTYADVKAAGK